ncbi:hypothetical protein, variant [Aphanomyces invadans]|uniref:Beta-catenin-like protein 1 N-terminal domain-containing protein n=1 Tax=Aphanomyces invadans TaxID=157072 RepID=A0A024TJX0_9STRA|nr:hypothetical protein, variant [Aphanomyces invadans]XP_008877105.1 hypothetical protein H310_11987 [Aphanomyces invadans]ETV94342.1 hypothetical protein H310_11987 [Aphanomyces invadans]ETV94343.1 hypothetical protein, variant [Aphanomyces invadans]|eukprot:XP_008877104.1 hypothetical protein, variant [Aphanomyces invadans]
MEAHFDKVFDASGNRTAREDRPERDGTLAPRPLKRVKHVTQAAAGTDATISAADDEGSAEFALNERVVKQMVSSLEKKLQKNDVLRSKYAAEPSKFMESEIALHEEITRIKDVATIPSLFHVLIQSEAIPLFVQLLTHENMDIRFDIIALLADVTDVADDDGPGEMEIAQTLVRGIVDLNGLQLLCDTLVMLTSSSVSEDDDATRVAIYNTLHIVENLAELLPDSCKAMATSTPMLNILLHQCSMKTDMTENRLYCSEILSIVLQSADEDTCLALVAAPGTEDRLDLMLQVLAKYRKKDPATTEEEEMVENVFNALCSALRVPAVQDRFRGLEGFELMLRCLKENKFCTTSSLRVLDHAIMNHTRNCERLIQIGGLKQVFPAFMGKIKRKKRQERVQDEHLFSILATLCLWLPVETSRGAVLDRLHAKFRENNVEKTDRLLDQFLAYYARVHALPKPVFKDDDAIDEYNEAVEGYRLHQLEVGLFPLQQIAFVLCHLVQVLPSLRAHVAAKLRAYDHSMDTLRQLLVDQVASLTQDDDDGDDATLTGSVQLHRLTDLIHALEAPDGITPT